MNNYFLSSFIQDITFPSTLRFVSGFYVYEWRDGDTIFYVGAGTKRRAWNEHLPLPENRRRQAKKFRVHIFKHELTKDEAHAVERMRTLHLSKLFDLYNTRIPNVSSVPSQRRKDYYHCPTQR
jgi:hypothetical protein